LLGSELAPHLTCRYVKTELFPFSFAEYLKFRKIDSSSKATSGIGMVSTAFDHYVLHGGFPEYLKSDDPEFHQRIYEDVIYRDLIVRFGINNIPGFNNLVQYLFTIFTKETNYNMLGGLLGFNSTTSVRDYIC